MRNLKVGPEPGVGLRPVIPIIRTLKQEDCSELEVSLGSIIESVPDTQQTIKPTQTNNIYIQLAKVV